MAYSSRRSFPCIYRHIERTAQLPTDSELFYSSKAAAEVVRGEVLCGATMDVDLMMLQERCRKDPLSYRDDFLSQRRHFDALLLSTSLRPSAPSPRLAEVAGFMGAVAHCYDTTGSTIAPPIAELLTQSGPAMHPDTRRSLVKLLALLRARSTADPGVVIPLFFRLLACNDKVLRRMLHGHIVSDIKKLQASGHGCRRQLQSFLFAMVEDRSEVLVKRSLHVLVDLFRRKIWNDGKCANMIATACFHPATPVAIIAAKFILDAESKDNDLDSDSEDEDGQEGPRRSRDGQRASDMWKAYNMTGKKSSKKRKRMERVINRLTRVKSTASNGPVAEHKPGHPALEAMMLINDPQDFAERLFSDLQNRRRRESYENRLVLINLMSRLVGTHELILLNFYPFLQRYLQPAQPEVTRVLAYLTQACHDKVPSDVLHPILRGLADSFVSERSSPPAMAAGINTIRAICSRVPLAILDEGNENKPEFEQEAPLLEDLVQYKVYKDKGVMMAARSLIALYREVHPVLLRKKDRGRAGAEAVQKGHSAHARAYGELKYATGVDGVELLTKNDSDVESEDPVTADDDASEPDIHVEKRVDGEGGLDSVADEGSEEAGLADEPMSKRPKVRKSGESEDNSRRMREAGEEQETEGTIEAQDESVDEGYVGRKRIDEMEILSNEDFAKIRARRAAQAVGESARTTNTGKAVDPNELQGPIKRERRTLAERLESVLESRQDREKFGSKRGQNKGGGSTNKKKLKTKSNSMVIHKRRKRSKLSRREKQMSMRKKKDYK